MTKPVVSLIVAADEGQVIGINGKLPWRIPEDMKWFKANTKGKPCIMGRKTWESLPKRPLPERTNIVVTRDRQFKAEGAIVVHGLAEALAVAGLENPVEIMVIGGADIYRAAMALVQRVYLTRVSGHSEGDAYFPPLSESDWVERVVGLYPASAERAIGYSFIILERKDLAHVGT